MLGEGRGQLLQAWAWSSSFSAECWAAVVCFPCDPPSVDGAPGAAPSRLPVLNPPSQQCWGQTPGPCPQPSPHPPGACGHIVMNPLRWGTVSMLCFRPWSFWLLGSKGHLPPGARLSMPCVPHRPCSELAQWACGRPLPVPLCHPVAGSPTQSTVTCTWEPWSLLHEQLCTQTASGEPATL